MGITTVPPLGRTAANPPGTTKAYSTSTPLGLWTPWNRFRCAVALVVEGLISLKLVLGVGGAMPTLKDISGYSCRLIGFDSNVMEVVLKP